MLHGVTGYGPQHSQAAGGDCGQLTLFFPASVSSPEERGQHRLPTQQDSMWHVPLNEPLVPFLLTCACVVDGRVEPFPIFQTIYRVVTLC